METLKESVSCLLASGGFWQSLTFLGLWKLLSSSGYVWGVCMSLSLSLCVSLCVSVCVCMSLYVCFVCVSVCMKSSPLVGTPGFKGPTLIHYGLPRWLSGEELTCQCRRCKRCGFSPWVRKIPWRRKCQPTPVFLPGKIP